MANCASLFRLCTNEIKTKVFRYRRLVDSIFPHGSNEGLHGGNMQKLTFYAISHPEKLARIGEYLADLATRHLSRHRFSLVRVAIEAMDQLLQSCHCSPSLPQFADAHVRLVQKLLESNQPAMEQLATESFVKFANIEEGTPSYRRQYDFLICKFAQMCHSGAADAKRTRCAGLQGLRGVIWKSSADNVHDNIWEKQHIDKIVGSILFNLYDSSLDSQSPELTVSVARRSSVSPLCWDRPFLDSNQKGSASFSADQPRTLADQCLRDLMGKATFGSLRSALEPVLKHLDAHGSWKPPAAFPILCFHIILYSIQSQFSYFVIQELLNHLDTMAGAETNVRIGIAQLLASVVTVTGTSIGPLLLSIFNSLLKHVRASIAFAESDRCSSPNEERLYQQALVQAMANFAQALPDYQKVEIMMFTVGHISRGLAGDDGDAQPVVLRHEGEQFMQHVLVNTLLKVARGYRTAYLGTVFTDSFLSTLIQLATGPHAQVRLATQRIFHTLLDRHDNADRLLHAPYLTSVDELQLTVEKCSRPDQLWMRRHLRELTAMLYRAALLISDDEWAQMQLDALQCTMMLLAVEAANDEAIVELWRVCLSLQSAACDPELEALGGRVRAGLHNLTARFFNLTAQLLAIPALCRHVQAVVTTRQEAGRPMLDLSCELDAPHRTLVHKEESIEVVETAADNSHNWTEKPIELDSSRRDVTRFPKTTDMPIRKRVDDAEKEADDGEGKLLLSLQAITEALESMGKDTSRLAVPWQLTRNSTGLFGDDLDGGGTDAVDGGPGGLVPAPPRSPNGSVRSSASSLSLTWSSPVVSARASRRNTAVVSFGLNDEPTTANHDRPHITSIAQLRAQLAAPLPDVIEEQRDAELTRQMVHKFRTTPFEEITEEMARKRDETDLTAKLHRLLAQHNDSAKMAQTVGNVPKNIFELKLPFDKIY